jgi:hypothetical protein
MKARSVQVSPRIQSVAAQGHSVLRAAKIIGSAPACIASAGRSAEGRVLYRATKWRQAERGQPGRSSARKRSPEGLFVGMVNQHQELPVFGVIAMA